MHKAKAMVPKPTVPPKAQPTAQAHTSMHVRIHATEMPVRLLKATITPSRGPAPMFTLK